MKKKDIKTENKVKDENIESNKYKIIKQGNKFNESDLEINAKDSKLKLKVRYITPLVFAIIFAIIYIPSQVNWLLVPFGAMVLLLLFGWDAASRICPNCKKWNSVTWIKNETLQKSREVKVKKLFKKEKIKKENYKIVKSQGKCSCCNCIFEVEKQKNSLIK